jgi:hypothetical protein
VTETVYLKESVEAQVELTYSQACALNSLGKQLASKSSWWGNADGDAAPERTVIDCSPLGESSWSITVGNAIGAFGVDDVTFVVRPKIEATHALYLIARGAALPRLEQQLIALAAAQDLWEVLAIWFARCTERVVLQDLVRDYQGVRETVSAVRGQIDPVGSAGLYYVGRLDFVCSYDQFTVDNAFNRLLLSALTTLQSLTKLSYGTRRACRRLSAHFDGVGHLAESDLRVQTDRRTAYYNDALSLARLILSSMAIGLVEGDKKAWSFLIRTPEVVEAGVLAVLKDGLAPFVRVAKYSTPLDPATMRIWPDLRFDPPGAVGDVKYKVFGTDWPRGDLYQSVAFAAGSRTERSCVISFGDSPDRALPTVRFGDIEVSHIVWRTDSDIDPNTSAARLVDDCSQWLRLQTPDSLALVAR